MKSILLTTTALVAFAGMAAAEGHTGVSFSGAAALGYNDDIEDGFYWDADLGVAMSQELDNGVTAAAAFTLNVADNNLGNNDDEISIDGDYVVSLSTETAALRFGDVDPVAEANWGGVDGDSTAGFNDKDTHLDEPSDGVGFDAILMGEITFGATTAMLSYGVFAGEDGTPAGYDDVDALQVYVSSTFGNFDLEFAYQDAIPATDYAVFGVSGSTTFSGAEITLAYIDDETESSFGIGAAYPVGPVTIGGYYSVNDVAEDSYGVSADYVDGPIAVNAFYDFTGNTGSATEETEFGVEGSYAAMENLSLLAGYISTEVGAADSTAAYYVAGVYDLGGGAELLVSYAEDEGDDPADDNDEIGDPEYMSGTTVEVSFSF